MQQIHSGRHTGTLQFLKPWVPSDYLWDFPSYAQAAWLVGYGLWKLFQSQKSLLCGVQCSLKSRFLQTARLHLRPTSRKTHEVNLHASNSAGQPSRLSSQNVNPTTCSSGFQNIWICLHRQRNIPTLLAFTRELQPASEVLSKGWLQAELFKEYIVGDILSIHSFRWHFKLCAQIKLKCQKVTCLNHISWAPAEML